MAGKQDGEAAKELINSGMRRWQQLGSGIFASYRSGEAVSLFSEGICVFGTGTKGGKNKKKK